MTTQLGSSPVTNGTASFAVPAFPAGSPSTATNPLRPGTYTITATYQASTTAVPSQQFTGSHVISLAPTSVVLTPTTPLQTSYGGPVNGIFAISTVDPGDFPATGHYTVFDNGVPVPICTDIPLDANGQPNNCPYGAPIPLDVGPHTLSIQYLGDAVNAPSLPSVGIPYVVVPDSTQINLTSGSNPAVVNTPVTFTASVQGNLVPATGTVTFFDDGTAIGTGALKPSGLATFTTNRLTIGTHPITASYAATLNFNASTSPIVNEVITPTPYATNTTLQSSSNPSYPAQSVAFTAVVTGPVSPSGVPLFTPTGTVNFLDNGTLIGSGTLDASGSATFTVLTLSVGTHPITAAYLGVTTATYTLSPSTSAVLNQVVESPTLSIVVTPNPVSVEAGDAAALLVTVTNVGGPPTVTLSCSNLPYESQCAFLQTSISGSGSVPFAYETTAPHACGTTNRSYGIPASASAAAGPSCSHPPASRSPGTHSAAHTLEWGGPMLAGLLLLLPGRRRIKRAPWLLLLVVTALAGLTTLNGCGGACTDLGTLPNTYTFTVTASAGAVPVTTGTAPAATQTTASTTVKVTVQP